MNDMTWWQFAGTILVVVGGLGTWMRMTIKDAIGRLEKRMDQRFDAVDGRFEARFDGVDIRFAGIEKASQQPGGGAADPLRAPDRDEPAELTS